MKLAVIIPVLNGSRLLEKTIEAVKSGIRIPDELIVVDDSSTDSTSTIAQQLGARVITMPGHLGPAACRNRGVLATDSDVLVFIDADTCVHADTLERIATRLADDPDLTAVIGSYDYEPSDPGLCSQYRNLAHCYVHHSANHHALTFWSGCGAVRRSAFIKAGGFDERYRKPSVEDIELGYRMSESGAQIILDPDIMVKHTKRWTVRNSIKTDLFDRGIPWMELLLKQGRFPNDLNIRMHHRIATILTVGSLLSLITAGIARSIGWLSVSIIGAVLALVTDAGLFRFLYRRGGIGVAAVGVPMILIQNLCKFLAAIIGFALYGWPSDRFSPGRRTERKSAIVDYRDKHENKALEVAVTHRPMNADLR